MTLALLLSAAALASGNECSAAEGPAAATSGSCAQEQGTVQSSSPAFVQKRSVVQHKAMLASSYDVEGSDCAQRLNRWSGNRPAACIVVRDNKALLVQVPYGSSPGWDLPGGYHKSSEAACETAERETCEETGYSVRAVASVSGSVFLCEVTGSNVCRKPVDEGFLRKQWFSKGQLDGLKFRGGSWGDKVGMLKGQLSSGQPQPQPSLGSFDACGCRRGVEGWSSTKQRCSSGSQTDSQEAEACLQRNGSELDDCGCRRGREGWSSTKQRCSSSSQTDAKEAAACRSKGGSGGLDACGCKKGEQGWSSRYQRCATGSVTDSQEAAKCSR